MVICECEIFNDKLLSTAHRGSNSSGEAEIIGKSMSANVDSWSVLSSDSDTLSELNSIQKLETKSSNEIWSSSQIWRDLMTLPDAEEINNFIKNESVEEILKKNTNTALLVCSWLGKLRILKAILQSKNAYLCTTDNKGRNAAHLASYAGAIDCLNLLLVSGVPVHVQEATNLLTPLHCAAAGGHYSCLKALITFSADVNAGLNIKSPLHYAVQSSSPECIQELLQNKAIPNLSKVFSETPLHVAASLGNVDILKLLIKYGAAVNVQWGPNMMTPLHLSAEDGNFECLKVLIEAGGLLSGRNQKEQTPLHLVALSKNCEAIELLLRHGADPNAIDVNGRTALHCVVAKITSKSYECVDILLAAKANVNTSDIFGYTPLHLAALNESVHCVMLLINNGGDLTIKTNGGISVLNFIIRKIPEVIPKYISKLDECIKMNDHEVGDVDCELKLNFEVLIPSAGKKETELLLNFIEIGQKDILQHPLCETFLLLKWRKIRKLFLFSLVYNLLFVVIFTIHITGIFLNNCTRDICYVPGYILTILNMLLLCNELFQISHFWLSYMKNWENWIEWLIIVMVFLCVQPKVFAEKKPEPWQFHVAAYTILLSWLKLMLIIGRFPIFGLYIQMFTRVFINFMKCMAAYLCLLIAFALSFAIIFAASPQFQDLKWALLKVIVMMSGELEYEELFHHQLPEYNATARGITYPLLYTSHLIYFCFVLLVTFILSNLLVGLAVSDIQQLQQDAGLDKLVRQVELVGYLESILFSRIFLWFPKTLGLLHKQALLFKSPRHWALNIRPNDPRKQRIPKHLIQKIYKLVVEKREWFANKKHNNIGVESSSFISPCISIFNSPKNKDKLK